MRLAAEAARRYIKWMHQVATVLLIIAMLTTLAVLFAGLISMARGGEFNRKYGNRLMRLRVAAQFTAIVIFAVAMLLSQA